MGASSSGLLDEAKISHIKGLGDSTFQSFSVFYRQQYSVAYFGHLHQEVEPKKEGRGLLLTHRPQCAPDEVLYQGTVKFSCWDEQGKKCRERYAVLRRDYKIEIHDNMETFSRGSAAKLVLQPAGGSVFTTEEESRAHLEKTCAGILNGVKEDPCAVVSPPDVFVVFLHLPYRGHTYFLFQQEAERDHFLSGLRTCIRHRNLDPWCGSSYESQAFARALQLHRQDKGCYEFWEMLLGTEEQVLASQVMEEVLPWLQSQLQSRLKGKKTERIRQWLATVQATYTLVLEQLTAGLQSLRDECRQSASANQALIRSNLDQIMSSHCFVEQKVRACICDEAEKVYSDSVAPYVSSILEALTENISSGMLGMRHTLHTHMDSAFSHTPGGTEETKAVLSSLRSVSLDESYRQVENLTEKLRDLKQRFGQISAQRLVHSAHLEMEQLLDSAVYTLEQFIQSSARLQPSQVPVKMDRAKERVLKQLDYDSRVVQRRLYEEALLEITLPSLISRMDSKWKTDLQQLEQHIFSDYSSFILVHNIYNDVLRNILSKEIETVVQDAASKKTNNLLLDTSDLAISQYSLLGQTPPRSAPGSPGVHGRHASSATPSDDPQPAPVVEDRSQTADVFPQYDPELKADADPDPTPSSDRSSVLLSPVIVVTQQVEEVGSENAACAQETSEEVQVGTDTPSTTEAESSASNEAVTHEVGTPDPPADPGSSVPDSGDPSPLASPESTDVQAGCCVSDQPAADLSTSDQSEEGSSVPPPSPSQPPASEGPVKISLGSLSEAIGCSSTEPPVIHKAVQQTTDRAVYLTGQIKDNWEVERVKEEKQKETAEEEGGMKTEEDRGEGKVEEEETEEERCEGKIEVEETEDRGEGKIEVEETEDRGEGKIEVKETEEDRGEGKMEEEETEEERGEGKVEENETEKDRGEGKIEVMKTEEDRGEGKMEEEETEEERGEGKVEENETEKDRGEGKVEVKETEEDRGEGKIEVMKTEEDRGEGKMEEEETEEERGEGKVEENETEKDRGEGKVEVKETEEDRGEGKIEVKETEEDRGEGKIEVMKTEEDRGEGKMEEEETEEDRGEGKIEVMKTEEDRGEELREEVLQSPQPMGSQSESDAELPLDSVAIIRDLVTEITEVETLITPCPNGSSPP